MLLRLIVFFLLAYLFFIALKAYFAGRASRSKDPLRKTGPNGDEMVLDPQCQSYVPKKEAIQQEGHYFCSRECAALFLSR